MSDVVCIGSAIVDVLVQVDDAFIAGAGLDKGAMRLVEADEAKNLYAALVDSTEQSGGAAANTAAIIAKLGGDVVFIGRVANDALGAAFTHDIRQVGVTYDPPPAPELPSTAHCTILITPDGERTMNTYLGACGLLSPTDIEPDVVVGGSILFVEGFLWDPPLGREAVMTAIAMAKDAGRQVALSLNDPYCVDRHRDEFTALLKNRTIDLVFGNDTEAPAVFETDDIDDAIRRLGEWCPHVVVTRGEKGSSLVIKGERIDVPSVPVDVIDTTGAGDAFAGGYLYGITHGYEPAAAAALGSACASAVIVSIGARPHVDLRTLL